MKSSRIIAVTIFSVAMVTAVWIGGKYFNRARGHAKTVSVVGKADRDFTSDLIVWRLSFNVLNTDMKQGYTQIKDISNTVRDYLKNKGVKVEEMEFDAIDCDKETEYHWDQQAQRGYNTFVGYRLRQTIKIESNDVDKVENISREISELLDKGIQLDNNYLSYYYTKLADLKIEMLAEATKDARNRAETIAKSAGARLGVFQITAPNSSDEDYSWGGTFNTTSKKKRASINMRLTYYVK